MLRPQSVKNRNRRALQKSNLVTGVLAMPTLVDFTTPNIIMTFPTPVVLKGVPTWLTNTGKMPISATISASKLQVTCLYDTPGAVTSLVVAPDDYSIKTYSGGRVPAGTFLAT